MQKKLTLNHLLPKQRAKIIALNFKDAQLRRHLLEMGFTKGTVVEIKRIAPLGDPVILLIRGYAFCMRKEKLKYIEVEVLR